MQIVCEWKIDNIFKEIVCESLHFLQVILSRYIYLKILNQLKSVHLFTEVSLNGIITLFDYVDDIAWSLVDGFSIIKPFEVRNTENPRIWYNTHKRRLNKTRPGEFFLYCIINEGYIPDII